MADPPEDTLADLRRRIEETRDAAERLAGEAAGARADEDAGREPPHGWRSAAERGERASEIQAIVALLESLRDLVPAELAAQVTEVVKQVLLLLRALIDWLVERLEVPAAARRAAATGPDVQDIPLA